MLSPLHGTGDIPEELGTLTALEGLYLNNNLLTGELYERYLSELLNDNWKLLL